jgi:hypothetical protein
MDKSSAYEAVHEDGDVIYAAGAVSSDVKREDAVCCDIQSDLNCV